MSSSTQILNTFASLGVHRGDTYSVNEDCLPGLNEIVRNLAIEDQTLRTFRRAIGFGQNVRKDLIPLLIYVKDDTHINDATKIIDTTIKILVDLTVPVECLLPTEAVSRTDIGRHTIFELNRLLTTSKEAFTDSRSTKAVMDHMKHMMEKESKLDVQQCDSINNCLLLLRNVLHIPEYRPISNSRLAHSGMQNEIIWNLFTQSIDKIIIYLMSCPERMYWGVTMVQLIALMYKDQHVGTLQKLLNLWLEASLSESSEDNESNTSPPNRASFDSSPIVTSAPTSDSSDNGVSRKSTDRTRTINSIENRNKNNTTETVRAAQNRSKASATLKRGKSTETDSSSGVSSMNQSTESNSCSKSPPLSRQSPSLSLDKTEEESLLTPLSTSSKKRQSSQSEVSDCGYGTQVERRESISTSSNDDDQPSRKPVHQKPHNFQKSRYNNQKNRATTALEQKELRRKKLVKRSKTNMINMKGLMLHMPTDEDISELLKEFTVDFLLKGYGSLVRDLHAQLLTGVQIQIDTSHFFWLVTYFLKFATQLELDLEHIRAVLSYEIISYLIFQGVWLYEELEISCKIPDIDLKPCLRRLHLVVTAIREFLQAVETYLKLLHISDEDRRHLLKLQMRISQTDDVKYLFLLLLRQYNPAIQSRQYLQDLIVTNHNYLLLLDHMVRTENGNLANIMEHLNQFASVEIMKQYGLLLENFTDNGEFVNNCIFTMMHHIGGDLEHVSALFQPGILKAFSQIWETDYEICDDWSDLIEYVIHKFINTPTSNHCRGIATPLVPIVEEREEKTSTGISSSSSAAHTVWTQEEKNNLGDFYSQSRDEPNVIASITEKYEKSGNKKKSQNSIIKELLAQNIISECQYNNFMRTKSAKNVASQARVSGNLGTGKAGLLPESLIKGDVKVLKEYVFRENKGKQILWLQKLLIEACYVTLTLANAESAKKCDNVMEPSVYHNALLNLPIPLVPWTIEQQNVLKYQPFVLLLHKLGFYLPCDTGKVFVRIPNFWTADYLFGIAQQLGPIDSTHLKFDVNLLEGVSKPEHKTKLTDCATSTGKCKFSVTESKRTPSVVRYTPLPNCTEWVHSITPVMNSILQIPSNNKLLVTIPETASTCDLSPPKLCIVLQSTDVELSGPLGMDISLANESSLVNDDIEHNSAYETTSVASDLTRLCVSDEEYEVEL